MRDGASAVSRSKGKAGDQPNQTAPGSKPAPGLYLVATPIGNLDDITLRAVKVLRQADLIACEDTRVSGKLLSLLGISGTALTPYHEHNAERARPAILARLREGAVVALVSDAGTPLVSDPGYRLVRDCVAEGLAVTSLPGASAVLTAMQLSGLPSDRFLFSGFLPVKDGARRRTLEQLAKVPASLVFYESPRRLAESLAVMADVLGPRSAAVARELTKLHEEVRRADLTVLASHYAALGPPKGEVVIVIAPPDDEPPPAADALDAALRQALASLSLRDAAATVATATGLPKRQVYARAVALSGEGRE
ncbi:16S rRNA (cytidine(1402)-2'-O)-methyltransferase [Telmatospirillum sp.]|uniref:16S rRNA (cytidine(1402)-2'-O)-methyltransferase n=1 Tax=Telmatospirillum sp. TaxID=2079197 RepID=UPI00284201F4|nr:16S rRNA (cytidine(1402)-2'-O)-methyltransferase [Telmatospirillum sp.]MDR3439643.1 16S rRNA (cytidine(1402)-2'-O)-methyltransferase [Telmatospirillum sp.]